LYGAGIVPVLDREGRVRGVLSEHDLVKYLAGVVSIGLKIRDIMSTPVVTVNENSTLKETMETWSSMALGEHRSRQRQCCSWPCNSSRHNQGFGTHRLIASLPVVT